MSEHARLSASSAHRWMNCAGAPRMEAGLPDIDSEFSLEGTAAHKLAADALTAEPGNIIIEATTSVGVRRKDGEEVSIPVTTEMRVAVALYVDVVLGRLADAGPGAKLYIEYKVGLEKLGPPEPMFGTADALIVGQHRMILIDFKYGVGVVVEVIDNPQTMEYLLAGRLTVLDHFKGDFAHLEYEAVIVQPRAAHPDGPVRSQFHSWEELRDFGHTLLEAAKKAHEPEAKLTPGSWCRWCKAAAFCPALASVTAQAAQDDFSTSGEVYIPASEPSTTPQVYIPAAILPNPEHLPLEVVLRALDKAEMIEGFLSAVRERVWRELAAGGTVPGWKLVEGRPARVWDVAEEDLAEVYGEELYSKVLRSPAQIEKIVGRGKIPKEFIRRVSKSVKLAPESDKRPAIAISAQDEFRALPPARDSHPSTGGETGETVD